jgi:hypothetical protein
MENKYMIEFHNVPHELSLYFEEIKVYGEVFYYNERYPMYIWIESFWEKDILESAFGVKKVYPKRFNSIPLSVLHDRNWTELLNTKWELNPE